MRYVWIHLASVITSLGSVHTKQKWEQKRKSSKKKRKRSENKRQTSKKIVPFAFACARSEQSLTNASTKAMSQEIKRSKRNYGLRLRWMWRDLKRLSIDVSHRLLLLDEESTNHSKVSVSCAVTLYCRNSGQWHSTTTCSGLIYWRIW